MVMFLHYEMFYRNNVGGSYNLIHSNAQCHVLLAMLLVSAKTPWNTNTNCKEFITCLVRYSSDILLCKWHDAYKMNTLLVHKLAAFQNISRSKAVFFQQNRMW